MIFAAILIGFLAIAQWRGWIDLTGKHESGGGTGMLGIVDEIFAPHRHEIQVQQEKQDEIPAPTADAPDGDLDVSDAGDPGYRGRYSVEI